MADSIEITSVSAPTKKTRRQSQRTAPRVDVEFFDQQGVQELRRTLTRQSGHSAQDNSSLESGRTLDEIKEFDFEQVLRDFVQERNEAQIKSRELGVMFRDLRVVGAGATSSFQPTIGSMFSPKNIVQEIQKAIHPPVRDILTGFEGVVRPGEMLLVLGRPGSGCTTLLKTLTNQRAEFHSVLGEVHYDSISPEVLQKHFRGDVQFCPEDDIHFPTLTVEQTIKFAAKTRLPQTRLVQNRDEGIQLGTDILTTIFGLRHVKDTMVGDEFIRGVSGGQKKRVSIAEALATRSLINAWDNSTRGLDASTALEFIQALRIATDVFRATTIVTLYQAGESLYKHFDKVCLVYEGRMAYFGPTNQARQYFIDMGYEPINRQTTADFLVSLTDPAARILRAGILSAPRTADDFAKYFLESALGKVNRDDMLSYEEEFVGQPQRVMMYTESARAEYARGTNKKSPYITSIAMQTRAVMLRRVQIMWGNKSFTILNMCSFIFQALIMGSVFLRMEATTDAFFSRGGVLFFAILFTALTAISEIPALFAQRPIIDRHEKAALYHPFVESLATTLVDVPITFVILALFGIVLYFMTGLQETPAQFFIYFLFLFTTTMTMKTCFRAVATAVKQESSAMSVAGLAVLALVLYSGFMIPKPSMIGALRWINFINPVRYSFEAMLSNEFRTLKGECTALVPQGPGYENITLENQVCTVVGAQAGQSFVDGNRFIELAYGFSYSNTWMNFGILIAFGTAFILALLFATEFNTSAFTNRPIILYKRGADRAKAPNSSDEEAVPVQSNDLQATGDSEKGEVLVHNTDVFSWQKLNYTVPISGEPDRRLLSDVSGYVAPGKLTALMGESGAGKTTLLNALAQRTSSGVITGDRFVNGQVLPPDFQSQTGYCQQQDTQIPTATVREALLFSAKLRQPPSVPLSEKEAYVEKCLKLCGLEAYADAICGSLNTELRKRTTIAVELAAKPKLLLFLDEPTSGLDSQSAWAIVQFLRNLADNGQAILCTIHQPSAELFQVFDRLLLLRRGGETVYFGDIGTHASTMISYLERNGARKCTTGENPAEYMLDIIGAGATASAKQDWHKTWTGSTEAARVQEQINTIHTEGRRRPAAGASFTSEFATPWTYQLANLFARDARSYWRNPTYLIAKLVLNAVGGLFIGFSFFDSKDTQQGTQNKLFAIFMTITLSAPLVNQLQVPFINIRTIYEARERPSRMYSWTALVTSQFLIEVPWNMLASSILFCCWYFTVGFSADRAGYTYLMMGIVLPLYYTTIGQAAAAMSSTAEIAALLFSVLFTFIVTFNGVLQPFRLLGWWEWMYRLSPYTYLVEGLLGQAIGRQSIQCSAVEFVPIKPPVGQTCQEYMNPFISTAGGYLTNPNATDLCQFCSMDSSDTFLKNAFNIYYDHHWRNFGIMIAFAMFNLAATFALTYLFRIHKGSWLPGRSKKN